MKLQVLLVVASLAAASSAAAEGFGTPTYGARPRQTEPKGFALPSTTTPSPSNRFRTAGTPPAAPGFKPYQGQSVYSHPKGYGGAHGAKDCELSVYTNACGRTR